MAVEAGAGGVTLKAAGSAERTVEAREGGAGVASMAGMAWARCWAFEGTACCSPPWGGRASTLAMTGGATVMCSSALGFPLEEGMGKVRGYRFIT